jgi:hypothetical protein
MYERVLAKMYETKIPQRSSKPLPLNERAHIGSTSVISFLKLTFLKSIQSRSKVYEIPTPSTALHN